MPAPSSSRFWTMSFFPAFHYISILSRYLPFGLDVIPFFFLSFLNSPPSRLSLSSTLPCLVACQKKRTTITLSSKIPAIFTPISWNVRADWSWVERGRLKRETMEDGKPKGEKYWSSGSPILSKTISLLSTGGIYLCWLQMKVLRSMLKCIYYN